ncbi:hypothetical protein Acr_14g0002380 [Actinidia rufa]|uniref:Uncharacterized protein n=1 Tax=Actinidia rufa TaxID=165716 RepID=A0A7J0FPF4_9ERIC|nr:hypothetical protein Acr_14g0002380 [Actinidia rufa]
MDPYDDDDDSVQQAAAAHYAARRRNTNTLMLAANCKWSSFLALCGELVNKYGLLVTDKGDCIGAIDGTHVEARLPPEKAVPYFDMEEFYLSETINDSSGSSSSGSSSCASSMPDDDGSMSDQRDYIRQKVVRQAARQSGR